MDRFAGSQLPRRHVSSRSHHAQRRQRGSHGRFLSTVEQQAASEKSIALEEPESIPVESLAVEEVSPPPAPLHRPPSNNEAVESRAT